MNIVSMLFPEAKQVFDRRKEAFMQARGSVFVITEKMYTDGNMEVSVSEVNDEGGDLGEVFNMKGKEDNLRSRFNAIMSLQETMFEEWVSLYVLEN